MLRVRQSRAVHDTIKETVHDTIKLPRVRQSRAVQGNSSRHDQIAERTIVSSCSRKQFTTRSSCWEYGSPELFKETNHDTIKLPRVRHSRAVQGNSSRHDQVAESTTISKCSRKQFTTRSSCREYDTLELFKETVRDTIKLLRVRQSRAVCKETVHDTIKLPGVRQSQAVQGNNSRHDQVAESTTVSKCSRKQFTTRSSCREYDTLELFKETVRDTIKLLRVRQSRNVQGNNSRHDQVAESTTVSSCSRKQFATLSSCWEYDTLQLFNDTVHDTIKLAVSTKTMRVRHSLELFKETVHGC